MTASLTGMTAIMSPGALTQTNLWNEKFALLSAYKDEHGDVRVPHGRDYRGIKLGQWVGSQRTRHSQGKMPQERINRLDSLGMVWSAREGATWQEHYSLLEKYRAEHGTANVPSDFKMDGVGLGEWLNWQHYMFALDKLHPKRAALLSKLGVEGISRWEVRYTELIAYKESHGHIDMPRWHRANGYALGVWLQNEKLLHGQGKMQAERVALLEAAGITWSMQRTAWDDALAILAAYKDEHGDANASDGLIYQDFPLGTWLQTQRREHRLGKIIPERVAQLDAVGMVWNFNDENWERNFALVVEFAKVHGHANIPQGTVSAYSSLGRWVSAQRESKRKGALTLEREQRLEGLGFTWDVRDATWGHNFALLMTLSVDRDISNLPREFVAADGTKLGWWFDKQRKHARLGTLSPERSEKLATLGITGTRQPKPGVKSKPAMSSVPPLTESASARVWDQKFSLLALYKTLHGDVRVPFNCEFEGVRLGRWVRAQRARFSQGVLLQERVDRLDTLGMIWDARGERSWGGHYEQLLAYGDAHGNVDVPWDHRVDGFSLAPWVQQQRFRYRQGALSQEQVSQLEAAGVAWSTPRTAWDDALAILTEYKDEHGDANAPAGLVYREFPLGTWVATQRREYRLGKMFPERIARLEALGMGWTIFDESWERHYALAVDFLRTHGALNVPYNERPLWTWLSTQRQRARKGRLSPERRLRLIDLGARLPDTEA